MKNYSSIIYLILVLLFFVFDNVFARPIYYSGGWTAMQSSNATKNSIHIHYSPTYKYSIGYQGEYYRKDDIYLNGARLNNLIQRWNLPAAQGNIYLKSAIGNAHQLGKDELYGFVGIAGDFETRKYFISYENSYYKSDGNIIGEFSQLLRIGVAPYVANYGNLHSWIMLQISRQPEFEGDEIILMPLVRLFKGSYLAEFGFSSNKRFLFNLVKRF
jgi:hypothetical protein